MPNEVRSMTDLPGSGAYIRALGFEGANQATASAGLVRVGLIGRTPTLAVNAGRNIVLTDFGAGILYSTSAGNTALLLRTHTAIGITYDPTFVRSVQLARWGDGALFLNADTGVTIYANDLAPEFLPKGGAPVTLTEMGVNTWFLS